MSRTSNGEYLDLVRFRNDGDDFHVLWTARRALRLLSPATGLVAVAVEGLSPADHHKGKRLTDGLLVADTVEYYGAEEFGSADRVIVNQLKHSTAHAQQPWAWSGIAETIEGFAARFRRFVDVYGVRQTLATARFRFVTNRPISANVRLAIEAAAGGNDHRLKGHSLSALNSFANAAGLDGLRLRQFASLIELCGSEPGRISQAEELAGELARGAPRTPDYAPDVLKERIRSMGTTSGTRDPVVRQRTVLRCYGVDDPGKLLPSPPYFDPVATALPRVQEADLVEDIRRSAGLTLVTAAGGVGKSVLAQRVGDLLPTGSETVVFDGFAGGRYRAPSEARHRHDVGLVHIANTLAARSLCEILVPTLAPRHEYLRAFRQRLEQAAAIVRARNPDALVVIILDAADNSVYAANLTKDECFVSDLMKESPPEGCRIVAFARPNRTDELTSPGQADPFRLNAFTTEETFDFARLNHPQSSQDALAAFHMRTFGNPRVQAYQLATANSIEEIVRNLGPGGQSVSQLINQQLAAGLEIVRLHQPEADVDGLCTALAALPPLVPVETLAAVAQADVSAIVSFASDFAGGRAIYTDGDSLQFRDEPVEHWFLDNFLPDGEAASAFADRLAAFAAMSSYAALALPQLLERAGRHDELVALALGDGGDFDADATERRHIILHRVRFALKSAFAKGRFAEVVKLLIRGGEEVAATERQASYLAENADLVATLTGPAAVDDFVYRRRAAGGWFGSAHAYNAAMLAATPGREVEARSYHALALQWLGDLFALPDDERDHADVTDSDLAAIAIAAALIHGPEEAGAFLGRLRPLTVRYASALETLEKLMDAGRDGLVHDIGLAANDVYLGIAACRALRHRGCMPGLAMVSHVIELFEKQDARRDLEDYQNRDIRPHILFLAECAAAVGATDAAGKLLEIGSWKVSEAPFFDIEENVSAGLRTIALDCVLSGREPDRNAIWRRTRPNAREDKGPSPQFNAILDELLPTYLLNARAISGAAVTDIDAALETTRKSHSIVAFENHTERQLRGARFIMEIELLQQLGLLTADRLQAAEKALRPSEHGPYPYESVRVIKLIASDPKMHGEALRLASQASRIHELDHEHAASKAKAYAELARALMTISLPDAASYFDRGVAIVDRVGDEMHDRLSVLLGLATAAGADTGGRTEEAARVARIAEIYENINDHKFPWHNVASAVHSLDPRAALAAFSRLASRGSVGLTQILPDLLERLLDSHFLTLETAAAFHALGGSWDFGNLGDRLAERTASCRQEIFDLLAKDAIADRHDAWDMRGLLRAGRSQEIAAPELESRYRQLKEQDRGRSSSSYDPPPRAVPSTADWDKLFANCDLSTPAGIEGAHAAWRRSDIRSDLAEFGAVMRSRVEPGNWSSHVCALSQCRELDVEDVTALLAATKEAWRHSPAVAASSGEAINRLVAERAIELAGSYLWKDVLARLSALSEREASDLVSDIARHSGPHIAQLGSSMLFELARRFGAQLLDTDGALEALQFTLDRFEAIATETDGDGIYGPDLAPPASIDRTLAELLWTRLGEPDVEARWRAAHAIRRLARFGETGLLNLVIACAETQGPTPFLTRGFPFYFHVARKQLLIALARIADENPNVLASQLPFLRAMANADHRHVFERMHAARALLALDRSGTITTSVEERAAWRDIVQFKSGRKEQCALPEDDATATEGDADFRFFLPYDIEKKWANALAHAFGISADTLARRTGEIVASDLGVPIRKWDDDPRAARGIYRMYGRRKAELMSLRDYQAESAIAILLGELRSRIPLDGQTDEYLQLVLRPELLTFEDGRWLSDRLDPTPSVARAWLSGGYDGHWQWSIDPRDFEAMLFALEGRLCMAGSWTESDGYKTELVDVSSALVKPHLAEDLLRACHFNSRKRYHDLPDDDWERQAAGNLILFPCTAQPHRAYGIDDKDPFSGSIRIPAIEPGRLLKRMFDFQVDAEGREWSGNCRARPLRLSSRLWGERPSPWIDDKPRHGKALLADLADVSAMLAAMNRHMILKVELDRRESFQREKDLEYVLPYVRYFILDSEGILSWFEGNRKARRRVNPPA